MAAAAAFARGLVQYCLQCSAERIRSKGAAGQGHQATAVWLQSHSGKACSTADCTTMHACCSRVGPANSSCCCNGYAGGHCSGKPRNQPHGIVHCHTMQRAVTQGKSTSLAAVYRPNRLLLPPGTHPAPTHLDVGYSCPRWLLLMVLLMLMRAQTLSPRPSVCAPDPEDMWP